MTRKHGAPRKDTIVVQYAPMLDGMTTPAEAFAKGDDDASFPEHSFEFEAYAANVAVTPIDTTMNISRNPRKTFRLGNAAEWTNGAKTKPIVVHAHVADNDLYTVTPAYAVLMPGEVLDTLTLDRRPGGAATKDEMLIEYIPLKKIGEQLELDLT